MALVAEARGRHAARTGDALRGGHVAADIVSPAVSAGAPASPGCVPAGPKPGDVVIIDIPDDAPWEPAPEKFPFPFGRLNPIQARAREFARDPSVNLVLATPTNSGKTLVAECAMLASILGRDGSRAAYVAPLRALAQERADSWASARHPFSRLNRSILTGDWRLTRAKARELERSHVIVLTPEMLSVRLRNMGSEMSLWLRPLSCVVFDEIHLLGMDAPDELDGRGHRLEAAVADLVRSVPDCRIVAASATIPNSEEIARWIARITGRKTVLIRSPFRPTPLRLDVLRVDDSGAPYQRVMSRIGDLVCRIVRENTGDGSTLVFVHAKSFGRRLSAALGAPFHSADLGRDERLELEKKFRAREIPVLVSTSTTAWGINLPARHVVIAGLLRGLEPVHPYDIAQMAGRAGRFGLDDQGFVHLVAQDSIADSYVRGGSVVLPPVGSVMGEPSILAFHIVSLVDRGLAREDEISGWIGLTFAGHGTARHVPDAVGLLLGCGALERGAGGALRATPLGRIAARLYLSPFDVAQWRSNWDGLMRSWNHEPPGDAAIACAVADVPSMRDAYIPREHEEDVAAGIGGRAKFAPWKAWCVLRMLQGDAPPAATGVRSQIAMDIERLASAWKLLDTWVCHWGAGVKFDEIALRVRHGIPWEMVDLVRLDGIGRSRAEILWRNGIKTIRDVAVSHGRIAQILGSKTADRAVESARRILQAAETGPAFSGGGP